MFKKIIYFFLLTSLTLLSACQRKTHKKKVPCHTTLTMKIPAKQGHIIFINGSCSSGKSSISKILAQKLKAQYFAFDELVMPKILQKFIVKHYGPVLGFVINKFITPNFFSKVDFLSEKKKYQFQLKFLKDLEMGLADEPTRAMYRDVKKAAAEGKNVVVESPLFLFGGIELLNCLSEFEGTNITYVLAYCPWNDLINRLKKRNSSPNKKIHRELDWVVGNYMNCFEITPNCKHKLYLEYLEGHEVRKVIEEYSQPQLKKQHKKQQLHLLKETQEVALHKFSKDIGYYIYPRFKFNMIINTKRCTPEKGADVIFKYIQKKDARAQEKGTFSRSIG